jgi:ectoine hydroxylase-related dioxygenase (phytanoyl-CoA dioxygenase family)
VKGSHLWGQRFTPTDFGSERAVRGIAGAPTPDIDASPDSFEILSWDLEPGDCLVHHGMAMHGAPGNRSGGVRRRAHSIRFTGDDVRWDPRPGILENIPLMTTLPLSLAPGDRLTCAAFPLLRSAAGRASAVR